MRALTLSAAPRALILGLILVGIAVSSAPADAASTQAAQQSSRLHCSDSTFVVCSRSANVSASRINPQPPSANGNGSGSISRYVSPSGSDSNPGTQARPFATLLRARDAVRKIDANMTSDINVYLGGGTYRLSKELWLGPQDSGTNGFNVNWTGVAGQIAIISGARQITGWALSDPQHGIWAASVPSGLQTRQIYVNGMRASLASGSRAGRAEEDNHGLYSFHANDGRMAKPKPD